MTTNPRRSAVDLVVLGPPKSGTSSLYAALASHPGVDPSHAKEPLFFSTDRGLDLGEAAGPPRSGGYERGLSWFGDLFSGPESAVRLEGSTEYFASDSSATLLTRHAPDVHVAVCLREPAERLVSHYWHERRFSDLPPLADLIETNHARLAYWRRCSAVGAGLTRWLDHLPHERVHVVGFDEVRADVAAPANRVLAALGLPPLTTDARFDEDVSNVAGVSRSPRLQRLLTVSRLRRLAEELPDWAQRPLRQVARRAVEANLDRGAYPATDPDVLTTIRGWFAPDRDVLAALLAEHWPERSSFVSTWPN